MRILVTGASGFIGKALTRALLSSGSATIVLLDQVPCSKDGDVLAFTGDLSDTGLLGEAFADGIDVVYHLAAVPGGMAERDPALSRRINLDATLAIIDRAAAARARFVYASTIAVLGTRVEAVDDSTVPRPDMVYGQHKREVETVLSQMTRAGHIVGLALRLPGVVARPPGDAGLKSAFLSEVFHALREDREYVCPVSADATMWLMSVRCCVTNLLHARYLDVAASNAEAITLPALHVRMSELVAMIRVACGAPPDCVTYAPDVTLETAFGRLPALSTKRADQAGFRHDGDVRRLVETVVRDLDANVTPIQETPRFAPDVFERGNARAPQKTLKGPSSR